MQFQINKLIAVEAETPEEAVAKIEEGKTISLSVTQRQQTQQTIRAATPTVQHSSTLNG